MSNDKRLTLLSSLQKAEIVDDFGPWKMTVATSAGGAYALGFDKETETLLVVSSNGQGVFDCNSGERIYRNRNNEGYNYLTLEGRRLDDPNAAPFQMAGTGGGGLLTITSDGWSIDTLQIEWPRTYCILQPPKASIYFLEDPWPKSKKDATYHLVRSELGKPVAYGFSWTGQTLVWCDRTDLIIWTRVT